jgi:hypothetical protein
MRKHWILDDFGVSYFQTEGGSDHEHLGFDWKKALKTNCFCDFPWIYLPMIFSGSMKLGHLWKSMVEECVYCKLPLELGMKMD